MSVNSHGSHSYIQAIDGMRALAVISVLLFHLNDQWLPGGFVGVDLFFVISGYVVTRSIIGKNWSSAKEFFTTFLARRIARIYPALVVCLFVVTITVALLVPRAWLNDTSYKAAAAAFMGLSNFVLVYFTDGYFSERSEYNPFTHTWSLGIEEQFYVLFALLWWFSRNNRYVFWLTLIGSTILSVVSSALLTQNEPAMAYYLLPSRWWELAVGAGLAHVHAKYSGPSHHSNAWSSLLLATGLFLIGFSLIHTDAASFPFPDALMVVFGGLLCIHGTFFLKAGDFAFGLSSRPMIAVGKISYSLYLWHWPVIVIFKWTVGLETTAHYLLCAGLIVVLSCASYFLIEKPMRDRLTLTFTPVRLIQRGILVTGLGSVFAVLMYFIQPILSLSVTADTQAWYSRPSSHQKDWLHRSDKPVIYALGDSHAGILGVALQELEKKLGVESKIITESGCPIASLRILPTPHCQQFIENVIPELIQRFRPGDVVILVSLRTQRISNHWGLIPNAVEKNQPSLNTLNTTRQHAERIIDQLLNAGFKVILSAPLPMFAAPAYRCSDSFNRFNPVCKPGLEIPQRQALQWRETAMKQIELIKATHTTLTIWDPFFDICPGNFCKAVDGEPLFFDGDHLTGAGNRRIVPSLIKAVTD
ncbi:MAG: hypothetical protein RLZZ352_29 [Pseudomonadota bacterium]|jgi:peptidoglycan/LPS O-acetylase OafA/YrhL